MNPCHKCGHTKPDKGRAFDGRRVYRCPQCGTSWSEGMQGREKQYSPQRPGNQFFDTGASGR